MAYKYQQVKEHVESDGSTKLLDETYPGVHIPMIMKCLKNDEHPPFKMNFNNFQNGHRCPECAIEYRASKKRYKKQYMRMYVEDKGYSLLNDIYSASDKITIRCPQGHIFDKSFIQFKHTFKKYGKGGCPECWKMIVGKCHLHTHDYVQDFIESKGYKLLEVYIGSQKPMDIMCPKEHIFKMRWNNFHQGQRCPVCNAIEQKSTPEREVLEYVRSIYTGTIVENDRSLIRSYYTGKMLELDIWVPDIRMAIEFNGTYWHNMDVRVKSDKVKLQECDRKGITLMIISDVEWKDDKEEVKKRISRIISSLK